MKSGCLFALVVAIWLGGSLYNDLQTARRLRQLEAQVEHLAAAVAESYGTMNADFEADILRREVADIKGKRIFARRILDWRNK